MFKCSEGWSLLLLVSGSLILVGFQGEYAVPIEARGMNPKSGNSRRLRKISGNINRYLFRDDKADIARDAILKEGL